MNVEIADKEFVVFALASGCGKSTLLRLLAGLEEITDGQIPIRGSRGQRRAAQRQDIAMVFQSYALIRT